MICITLKTFQEKAVDFLFEKTTSTSLPKIILQAPTGSGKTIVLVGYVEKYLSYHRDTVICWLSPGKGELEEQSREKMVRFAPGLNTGNLGDILNGGFEAGTTYFINWETITKKDNKALLDSERKNLFERIAEAHREDLNFILIIDEEHQNDTKKADDIISALNARYEIRVSATPSKKGNAERYEIRESDVINEGLITRALYINQNLGEVTTSDIQGETDLLLEKADEIRKAIAKEYEAMGEDIRPLVLVQFPNLNDELIERVENKLSELGYTYENGLLASWFSAENKKDKSIGSKKLGKINIGTKTENSITHHNAKPVFLLFKQALSTGWDCPRAKVLVKLRENMNETFEIQTLGRLRRMPKARHYDNELLDCSYLYTFDEKYKLAVTESGNAFERRRLFLKDEARDITLVKEMRNLEDNFMDERAVRNALYQFFKHRYSLTTIKSDNRKRFENASYILGTTLQRRYLTGKYVELTSIAEDQAHYEHLNVEVNTHDHGIELQHAIDGIKKYIGLDYKKTRVILETLFRKGIGSDTYKLLNLNLREFYSFIINNEEKLKEVFNEFNEKGKKYVPIKPLVHKELEFKIPLEEAYRYNPYESHVRVYEHNVYKEYDTSMTVEGLRSRSERLFEKFCENRDKIKYFYKNGDSGQAYLSILYGTNYGKSRLFYPDYILVLEDESVWLIETKGGESYGESKNIDVQVENKFEAFKTFCQRHHYNFGFVRDKNDELYLCNTEYTDSMSGSNWKPLEEVL